MLRVLGLPIVVEGIALPIDVEGTALPIDVVNVLFRLPYISHKDERFGVL